MLTFLMVLQPIRTVPIPYIGVYSRGEGDMEFPSSVWSCKGRVFVPDPVHGRIVVLDSSGSLLKFVPVQVHVDDIVSDSSGLYLLDRGEGLVYLVSYSGEVLHRYTIPYEVSSQVLSLFLIDSSVVIEMFDNSLYDFRAGAYLKSPVNFRMEGDSILMRAFSCGWTGGDYSLIQPLIISRGTLYLYAETRLMNPVVVVVDTSCNKHRFPLDALHSQFPIVRPVALSNGLLYQMVITDSLAYIAIYRLDAD